MARFSPQTLSWKAVESDNVVGYNIYYAKGNKVDYNSESVYIQDITELVVPNALEGFIPERGIYMFGITSVDRFGNESDIEKLKEPMHFKAPPAPESFRIVDELPPKPESIWVVVGKTINEVSSEEVSREDYKSPGSNAVLLEKFPGRQP